MSIGLEGPNAFDGQLTITDYRIQQLGEAMGLAAADASALRGTISSSMSFKGDLRNATSMTMDLNVAPIDATVFDVPIALAHGLRATMTGGRLEIEDGTMTIGGVAVRAGGALDDRSARGETGARSGRGHRHAAAVAASRESPRELVAAGRITGHVQTERFAAGLAVTGSLNATLSTLSRGNKTVAQDVRLAIDLTGQRAEVREVAAAMLGGQLAATGGAPLVWLNEWLPPGWQIARPQIDAPATLEGKASFDVPALLDLFGGTPMKASAAASISRRR